ncbi:hypothetical protein TraAM80_01286 [Trypanosoma rangeli]|uniref:CCHC-type domain-containing protein n=1 Tax=Trypanosoma rangeli TaxID=5698 RepID=A0A3R7LBB3_TRYRA|nr:uncharacterized protein TraAM80_01286 [Trypanosoma rangeli]RNF10902.1 hypothetical protein TraAM80_01286 [Trypanosoma rangeli]|eukprot:RNF10902.1 hypothetical protein TraAM80_01286 [Trypanosoma rangeli]
MVSASQAERVQVVVRGQRFESTVEILSAYCVFFRSFFREARGKLTASNDVEGVDDDWWACHAAATRTLGKYLQRPVKDGELLVGVASIEFDRAASRWRFVYTAKTLAPEDVGVVLVYVRKLFRWSQQQQDQEREPQLPIRWDEMTYDAQLALARVVCSFGVEPLVGRFDFPTAPLSHGAGTEADPVLLRHMAEAYVRERLQREESLDAGAAQEGAAAAKTATGAGGGSRWRHDVEGDDLVLAAAACSRCGITGHTDVDCPK